MLNVKKSSNIKLRSPELNKSQLKDEDSIKIILNNQALIFGSLIKEFNNHKKGPAYYSYYQYLEPQNDIVATRYVFNESFINLFYDN